MISLSIILHVTHPGGCFYFKWIDDLVIVTHFTYKPLLTAESTVIHMTLGVLYHFTQTGSQGTCQYLKQVLKTENTSVSGVLQKGFKV